MLNHTTLSGFWWCMGDIWWVAQQLTCWSTVGHSMSSTCSPLFRAWWAWKDSIISWKKMRTLFSYQSWRMGEFVLDSVHSKIGCETRMTHLWFWYIYLRIHNKDQPLCLVFDCCVLWWAFAAGITHFSTPKWWVRGLRYFSIQGGPKVNESTVISGEITPGNGEPFFFGHL